MKNESVNDLVDEEPKAEYEDININWMQAIIQIKPLDLGRKNKRKHQSPSRIQQRHP
jgi:hypothetical protein